MFQAFSSMEILKGTKINLATLHLIYLFDYHKYIMNTHDYKEASCWKSRAKRYDLIMQLFMVAY